MQMTTAMAEAREEAVGMPLDEINLANPSRFEINTHWPFVGRRMRCEGASYRFRELSGSSDVCLRRSSTTDDRSFATLL